MSPRAAGRPRSTEAHDAILRAAVELIREIGYDAVGMEGIAARAGVGKTTLYRRWPDKETLVVEAIGAIVRRIVLPDTGSARGDVQQVLLSTSQLYRDPATSALLIGLIGAMSRSDAIAQVMHERISEPRRDAMRAVLRRGIKRGELRRGLPIEPAVDMLYGAMLTRSVVTGARIDDALVVKLVNLFFEAP